MAPEEVCDASRADLDQASIIMTNDVRVRAATSELTVIALRAARAVLRGKRLTRERADEVFAVEVFERGNERPALVGARSLPFERERDLRDLDLLLRAVDVLTEGDDDVRLAPVPEERRQATLDRTLLELQERRLDALAVLEQDLKRGAGCVDLGRE